jgi:hypothetical protein
VSSIAEPQHLHPSWCHPAYCCAPDRLAERGLDDASVPAWQRDQHLSAPRTVGAGEVDREAEVSFGFYLAKWVYEPVTDRPNQVIMALSWADHFLVIGAPISIAQLPVIREVFEEYAGAFPVGGER